MDYDQFLETLRSNDWSAVLRALEIVLPTRLRSYSLSALGEDIANRGGEGYIEKIWLEDISTIS